MDVFEYAMQMELDGKAFYEKSAAATTQPELKKILLQLAEEEQRHFQFFKSLKEGHKDTVQQISTSRPVITTSKNLFAQFAQPGNQPQFGSEVRAVWSQALKIEEKAEKMYRDEAAREPDPTRKNLLNLIADEEKTHVYLIDNMLSYMADPSGFVESADYRNFMSWEGR